MLAQNHVLRRAESQMKLWLTSHCQAAELATNLVLAEAQAAEGVTPMRVAGTVRLECDTNSASITSDYLTATRESQLRIERTQQRLAQLRQVFATQPMSHLWWLDQNPDAVKGLSVEQFGKFVSMIHGAIAQRDADATQTSADSIAKVLLEFIDGFTTPAQKNFALQAFRETLEMFGQNTLIDRLDTLDGDQTVISVAESDS